MNDYEPTGPFTEEGILWICALLLVVGVLLTILIRGVTMPGIKDRPERPKTVTTQGA